MAALTTNAIAVIGANDSLSYNGQNFDALTRSKVSGVPIYDDAGRMVKYVEWTLEVSGFISLAPAQTTNQSMDSLRMTLTEPGKALQYDLRGFGNCKVNVAGDPSDTRDVLWGPTPQLLNYVPLGAGFAAFVEWKVVFHIPECDHAKTKNRLMMGNYEVTWSIDDGWTSVTYTGAIEIPITQRINAGVGPPPPGIQDSADRWRYIVNPQIPAGFKREHQVFKLSKNRNRLDFTIVDKQVPVALPNGTTLCDVRHRVESGLGGTPKRGFIKWDMTLSGTIRVAPGELPILAWWRFALIVTSRLGWTRVHADTVRARVLGRGWLAWSGQTIGEIAQGVLAHAGGRSTLIVTDFSMEENIFAMESSFSLKYTVIGATLDRIIFISGLWETIAGTSHARYRESVKETVNDQRGQARLNFDHNADTLIDLCLPTDPPARPRSRGPMSSEPGGEVAVAEGFLRVGSGGDEDDDGRNVNPQSVITSGLPANAPGDLIVNEAASWVAYSCTLILDEQDHVIRHKPLSGNLKIAKPSFDPLNGGPRDGDKTKFFPLVTTDVPDIIQRVVSPSYTVRLVGSAIRMGFRITPPRLIKFAGQPVVPVQDRANTPETILSVVQGTPIYKMDWDISYIVAGPPRNSVPANPQLGTPGVP